MTRIACYITAPTCSRSKLSNECWRIIRPYLEAIAENPDGLVSQLPILTETERRRMLVEWNDTRADYPQTSVQQMFEEQVQRSAGSGGRSL